MGDQGRWFKLWTTAPADPHLGNLALEDFARWCLFGVYMKVHGTSGVLTLAPPSTALQQLLRLPSYADVIDLISRFPNCNVTPVTNSPVTHTIEWQNWQKYQGDYSHDRVARWRWKRRHSVTIKKRREEKRREDIPVVSSPETTTQNRESGSDRPKRQKRAILADDKFIEALKQNPAYKRLDLELELGKFHAWFLTPRGRGKEPTRGRLIAWLNRALEGLPLQPPADREEPYGFER